MSRHIDLGCGNNPRNPYNKSELYGVDISLTDDTFGRFKSANLFIDNIPFESNYFDSLSAYDFIEHVPRVIETANSSNTRFCFVELMSEIWRVLKPDGVFFASTPVFPNPQVFVDPTHVNFITEKTHLYFCGDCPPARIYGFKGKFIQKNVVKWKPRDNSPFLEQSFPIRFKRVRDFLKRRRSHLAWELIALKDF
tara:strand:- start:23416 stop:24000 length:585 start_codon:yes stop_codon:yes gene_type:complete